MRRGDIATIAIALLILGQIQEPQQTRLVGAVVVGAAVCSRISGLTRGQRELCRKAPYAMPAVGEGAALGLHECRHQFRHHRWNCSHVQVQLSNDQVFGHVVVVGSREAAFTYAISSAGITYAVTAACSRGNITACGCEPADEKGIAAKRLGVGGMQRGYHIWDEVHHHTQAFAIIRFTREEEAAADQADLTDPPAAQSRFARKFLDAREFEGDARSLMNLHNNRAGRKIVKALLQTECKCHGVSGSCTIRTCWRTLPSFRQIGDALKKKYDRARPVAAVTPPSVQISDIPSHSVSPETEPILGNDAKTQGKTNDFVKSYHDRQLSWKKVNRPRKTHLVLKKTKGNDGIGPKRIPKRSELVFLQPSPNYCEPDLSQGSLGTQSRYCNRTSKGTDGCDLMCCGRGYNTHQFTRTWQCKCKFHWCCRVHCETCTERTEEYTCK